MKSNNVMNFFSRFYLARKNIFLWIVVTQGRVSESLNFDDQDYLVEIN